MHDVSHFIDVCPTTTIFQIVFPTSTHFLCWYWSPLLLKGNGLGTKPTYVTPSQTEVVPHRSPIEPPSHHPDGAPSYSWWSTLCSLFNTYWLWIAFIYLCMIRSPATKLKSSQNRYYKSHLDQSNISSSKWKPFDEIHFRNWPQLISVVKGGITWIPSTD